MAQLARLLKWNEDQPRAENGQFGSGGGGSDRMYVEGASRNAGGGARAEVPKAVQGFYEQLKDEKDGGAARLAAGLKRMTDAQVLSLSSQASGLVGAGKFKAFADALNQAIRVEYNTRANTTQFQAAIRATRKVDLGRLLKWNPDQERDDRGRFGSGSGGGDLKSMFAESLGIPRAQMPQIPNGALKEKFIAEQAARGVRTVAEKVPATTLKPTQADFNPENIAYLREQIAAGTYKDTNPLVVSREGRVLDGHHRWAGAALDGEKLSILRVDLPIHELLAEARAFNTRNGVAPRDVKVPDARKMEEALELLKTYQPTGLALLKAWDADQERDEMGRWTAGGGGGSPTAERARAAIIARAPEAPKMPTLIAKPVASVVPPMSEMTPAQVLPAALLSEAHDVINTYHVPGATPSSGLTRGQEEQASRELAPVLAAAAAAKPAYDDKLRAIASKLGGEAMTAPLKGGPRLLEKHVLENNGQVGQMRDTVRGSIIVKSIDDVPAAIEAVRAQFPVSRVKDRFEKPLSTGYRDVLMNVHLPGGIEGEVQIHIPEMIAAKSIGHKVYDVTRSMTGGASNPEYEKLEGLQSRIYGAAVEANLRRRTDRGGG